MLYSRLILWMYIYMKMVLIQLLHCFTESTPAPLLQKLHNVVLLVTKKAPNSSNINSTTTTTAPTYNCCSNGKR